MFTSPTEKEASLLERLIRVSLRNKLLIVLFTFAVAGGGYWSHHRLPIDVFPDVSPVLVQVFTITEGLGPEEVESYVTYPVETVMSGLPRVEMIRSVSNFGLSVVSVYFEEGTDIYFARQLVGERLSEARENIPRGFGQPQMGPISTGQGLVLYYSLFDDDGRRSLEELRSIQDWIVKPNLQTVPGVTEVLGIGGNVRQFQINVDPAALLQFDLPLKRVLEQVEANNRNGGGQFLLRNGERFVLRFEGLARNLEDLEEIVLRQEGGVPLYLRDVATIETGSEIRHGLETMNGEREVVSGMVIKLYGSNSSTVIEAVEARLSEIRDSLPEGLRLEPYYEQKTLVSRSVETVTDALIQGVGLVVLVLLLFVGAIRPSLVVVLSIPFSVAFALLGMHLFGISANLMSLGGLAIAIGMMVDGAIVMAENAERWFRRADRRDNRAELLARACGEVVKPLTFSILIVVLVFVPLFTLQGVEGKTFRPLVYTVSLAMLGSLVYALLAAPVYAWVFMRTPRSGKRRGSEREAWLIRGLLQLYRPLVSVFVRFPLLAAIPAGALLILGALLLPRLGTEFTPQLQEGTIVANLSMAPSVSLEETKRNTLIAERRVMKIPEVLSTHSRIGRGEVGAHADPVNSVHMMVRLHPESAWREGFAQEDIVRAMRHTLEDMPGVLVNMTQPIQLTVDELVGGSKGEVAIKLFGQDLEILKEKADEIAAVVSEIRGAVDVQPGQLTGAPQIVVLPDRAAIARYGINVRDVQEFIEAAVGGVVVGQIFEGVRRFDVSVRFREEARATVEDLARLVMQAPGGARVTLDEIAQIREVVGPRQIVRENNQRYIEVQANVTGRDIGSFVEEAQDRVSAAVALPMGYVLHWGGQFELQQEANRRLALVVPLTIALVALLLYLSFGSIRNTILILLNIPLALVGGVAGLWLAGEHLSVPASVGFIALFGIALGNGMVLVSYLNERVRSGQPVKEASVEGACLRLRAVLTTAVTTALGLLPLLLSTGTGSEVQRPLALVVVGGLLSSTVLTLLIVPAFYRWFAVDPCPPSMSDKIHADEG